MDNKTKKDLLNKGSKILKDSGVDLGDVAGKVAKEALGGKKDSSGSSQAKGKKKSGDASDAADLLKDVTKAVKKAKKD